MLLVENNKRVYGAFDLLDTLTWCFVQAVTRTQQVLRVDIATLRIPLLSKVEYLNVSLRESVVLCFCQ